jgi:hypothetical protein
MLFLIGNTENASTTAADTQQNGLWKVNSDGTGLTRLVPTTLKQYSFFNYNTQNLWSNVSRDGSMYVLQVNGFMGTTETDALLLGSVNGGSTKTIVSTEDGSQVALVGWTTM